MAELVLAALAEAEDEKRRLFLIVDGTKEQLDWDDMKKLAGQPTIPILNDPRTCNRIGLA